MVYVMVSRVLHYKDYWYISILQSTTSVRWDNLSIYQITKYDIYAGI